MAQAFNLTAQLNLQGPANIGKIVSDLKKQIGTIEGDIKFKIDASTIKGVTQLNSALQTFNSTLSTTTSVANNAANALDNLKSAVNGINLKGTASNINSVVSASQSLSKATKQAAKDTAEARTELEEFGRQSALAVRRFAAFSVVSSVIFKVNNAVNQGVSAFIDYERQLFRLQQITGSSQKELIGLSDTIGDLATGLGVASSSLISIADTLAQAGLSAKDTQIALKALALTELAPSFDSLNETVEGSIALMRQFDISAQDLQKALGSINAVAARFAVESSDLITAIQRTGGVFATASKGVSDGTDALNEFLAVFTSVRATTRESAETIATGLRTIFTRIQREDTIDALEEYGVQLTDVEGKFVGAYRAVEALSRGLSKIDPRSLEFAGIVEELGGFRQIGKVIPLIQQFATAQEALKVAQTGQDSLAYDAVIAQQSLANQIVKTREQFLGLIRDIGQSQGFQFLVKGALSFTSALLSIADAVKGVLPILALIGLRKGLSAATQFGKGFIGGLKKVQDGEEENPTIAGSIGKAAGGALSGAKAASYAKAASAIEDAADNFATAADSLTSAIGSLGNKFTELNNYISSNIQALQNNTNSLSINTTSIDNLTQAILNFNPGGGGGPTLNSGGKVMGFARGGVVPGTGNRDTVPAMLQPGEFVIRKKAVETIGADTLHNMNGYYSGGSVRSGFGKRVKFARGGIASVNKLNKVYDGDTLKLNVTPTDDPYDTDTRLLGVDAFEVKETTGRKNSWQKTLGLAARQVAENYYLDKNTKYIYDTIRTSNKEKYGRPYIQDDNLASSLVQKGLAIEYTGTGSRANSLTRKDYQQKFNMSPEEALKRLNISNAEGETEVQQKKLGGIIQKFIEGGVVQRKVGYIDYDVIANEANKGIVEAGMKKTGITGPRLYSDYLTDLAVKARKDSSITKLRAIYGVAGSGKTTLARGQGTDDARLRKTERFPILSPEDIEKATEIIVLASSVSKKKLEELFSQTDRTYTLSSTTQAEKERIKNQRASRDITGVGLEGRMPGSTTNVANDTAVGEALLTDTLGEKSVVLGRTDTGRLRRKKGDELVEIIKKKIGFTWGGFAPMTAGHESIMDSAAAMGISPEDFIYLVGANEGVDAKNFRTAIFDQDARVLLARAGAGAKGATVLPKPRDFEVPQAFDISPETGRRKVLVPGKGSTAFVADKSPEELKKYKEAGYKVKNLERMGGISGTMVRDLIAAGDLGQLQSVLSPGVYDLISNNIGRIQNRANILPSIIQEVQQIQGVRLSEIDDEIKKLGISRIDSKKVASDPEYAAKVEVLRELRARRDKIKSAGSFEPYRLLAQLAAQEPEKYGLDFSTTEISDPKPIRTVKTTQRANLGGMIQKFLDGGWVERMKKQKKSTLQEDLKYLQSAALFAGDTGAYIPTYLEDGKKEKIESKELLERYQALSDFLGGSKTKQSPLKPAGGYTEDELLDAVKYYQGGSGPLARAMVNKDFIFTDRDEAYETEDVVNRLKASAQYKAPKKLYTGLGRGQINEILKDTNIDPERFAKDGKSGISNLVGQTIDFPTFLSTSFNKGVAENFIGDPGALMTIDASKSSQLGIDVDKAKGTKALDTKSTRRLPGLEKINPLKLIKYDEEKEFILQPDAKFKILKASGFVSNNFRDKLMGTISKKEPKEGKKSIQISDTGEEFIVEEPLYDQDPSDFADVYNKKTKLDIKTQMLNSGGLIQRFMAGGVAEDAEPMTDAIAATKGRAEILDLLGDRPGGLQTTATKIGVGIEEMRKALGVKQPDARTKALQDAIRHEYVSTYNRRAGAARGTTTKLEDKDLVFAAAGLFGKPFPPENIDIVSNRLKKSAKVRVVSGVMEKAKADQIDQLFTQGSEDLAEKAASIVSGGTSLTGKTISNPNAEGSIQGGLIEKMVQRLGGPGKTPGQGFDFPNGLQGAAKYFNVDPDLPTDVKRTLKGPSTFTDNIITYLKNVKGYATGGTVSPEKQGEAVGPPELVAQYKQILASILPPSMLTADGLLKTSEGSGESIQIQGPTEPSFLQRLGLLPKPKSKSFYRGGLDTKVLRYYLEKNKSKISTEDYDIISKGIEKTFKYLGSEDSISVKDSVHRGVLPHETFHDIQGYLYDYYPEIMDKLNDAIQSKKSKIEEFYNAPESSAYRGKPNYTLKHFFPETASDSPYKGDLGAQVSGSISIARAVSKSTAPISPEISKTIIPETHKAIGRLEVIPVLLSAASEGNAKAQAILSEIFGSAGLNPDFYKTLPKYARGGSIQDTVPALLTPGEFVINKKAAQQIGYNKLNKLNQADKIQGYNRGGAVGRIQKFATGGTALDLITSYREQKAALEEELGSATGSIKTIIQSKIKNLEKDIQNASNEFDTLSKIIASASSKAEQRQSELDKAEQVLIDRLNKSKFSGVDFTALPTDIQAKIFDKAKAGKYQVGGKDAFEQQNKAIEKAQARLDTAIQVRDRAKTEKEVKFGDTTSQDDIVSRTRTQAEIRATEEAKQRAEADRAASINAKLLSVGLGAFDSILKLVTKNMTGLSKVISDVIAGASGRAGISKTIYDELSKRTDTTRTLNKIGQTTGINSALQSIGLKKLGTTIIGVTRAYGPYIAATYIALGAIKDFANGLIEQEKKLNQAKIEQSTNRITYLFDKMAKDIDQANTIATINNELNSLASSLNRQVELNQKAEYMWYNILDWLGQSGALGAGTAERANQRGVILKEQGGFAYLKSALSDLVFGTAREENYSKLIPKVVQQRAEEGRKFAEPYSKITEARLRQGEDVSSIMADLGTMGKPSDRARQLATQDVETQAEIERIRSGPGGRAYKQERIAQLESAAASAILAAQLRAQEAAIVAEQLNKIGKDFVTSIQRLMKGMEESIGKTSFSLQELSNQAKLSRESLSGKAGAGAVSLKSINVIRNAGAYSQRERSEAFSAGGRPFGMDAKLVQNLLAVPNALEDKMSSAINKALIQDRNAGEKKISTRVEKAAIESIQSMDLGSSIESLLLKQTRSVFQEISKRGEDTISFRELAERIPLLGKQIEAAQKAQETAIKALELWQSVLNSYSEAMNRQVQDQIDINNLNRKAADIRSKGEIALSEALGKEVSLRQRINSSLASTQSMTGGEINPSIIGANILNLENVRQKEQDAINAIANSSIGITDNFQLMSKELSLTNTALRENYAALESLANNSDIASAALNEMQKISNRIKAGENFIEKLVTSSPEEIGKLNRSFALLSNNLRGRANIGSTSEDRAQALQLFNTLGPLLGTGQKQNELRANVLESMLKESNIAIDSNLQSMVDAIRNPERDTEMQEAISIYKSGVELQANANQELAIIKETLKKNDLAIANQQLISGFANVLKDYNSKQLDDIRTNTRETADALQRGVPAVAKASGGTIYARTGQSIFQPKGTDTVPAMLTPGEFVVNRKAASQNLPLLQSINNGYANGGKVSYYADGGYVVPVGGILSGVAPNTDYYKRLFQNAPSAKSELSDYKYPTKKYLDSLLLDPRNYTSIFATSVAVGSAIPDAILLTYKELQEEAIKQLRSGLSMPFELPSASDILSTASSSYIGTQYDSVTLDKGTVKYGSIGDYDHKDFTLYPNLNINTNESNSSINNSKYERIPKTQKADREAYFASVIRAMNAKIKDTLDAGKEEKLLTTLDQYNKFRSSLDKPNVKVSYSDYPYDGYRIENLSKNIAGEKYLGLFYPEPEQNSKLSGVSLGFKRSGYTVGSSQLVSGPSRENAPRKGLILDDKGGPLGLNRNVANGQIYENNAESYRSIKNFLSQLKNNKDKFSFDLEAVKSQKDIFRKIIGLYNNYTDYIDLSKIDAQNLKLEEVLQASNSSVGEDIFPIRIYRNEIPFDNERLGDLLKSNYTNENFLNQIYDSINKKLITSNLELESYGDGDEYIGKGKFSQWLPTLATSDLESIIANPNAVTAGREAPIKNITAATYKDPDDLFQFKYRTIDSVSAAYNPNTKSFTNEKIYDAYPDLLKDNKLTTIDQNLTTDTFNPFYGMLRPLESLVVNDSVDNLASKIRMAFFGDPNKPSSIASKVLSRDDENIIQANNQGIDFESSKFGFYGSPVDKVFDFNQEFIKSYNSMLASKSAKDAKKGAAAVSRDLITGDIDTSFDQAKRVSLGRIAFDFAKQKGIDLKNKPENIDGLEYIRGDLNSRIGKINNSSDPESIKLEAFRRLFTEISGTKDVGIGRSYLLAGSGIDIGPIGDRGLGWIPGKTINDPALRGKQKTLYYDNPGVAGSIAEIFNNLVQREINILRAQRLGADATLGADVQAKARALLENGMFYSITTDPTGKGRKREQLRDQEPVLGTYADIFRYSLTPSNIFANSKARGQLIDELINYYQNALGNNGQLVFEDSYIKEVTSKLETLKSWYADQDFILNASVDFDKNINDYNKLITDLNMANEYSDAEKANKLLTSDIYGSLPTVDQLNQNSLYNLLQDTKTKKAIGKANGGLIYASDGTLVNFQRMGTDTVPAMLTPGEFVVNRQATKNNLPLLQAINSNNYQTGGKVHYLKKGSVSPVGETESSMWLRKFKDILGSSSDEEVLRFGDPKQILSLERFKQLAWDLTVGGWAGFGRDIPNTRAQPVDKNKTPKRDNDTYKPSARSMASKQARESYKPQTPAEKYISDADAIEASKEIEKQYNIRKKNILQNELGLNFIGSMNMPTPNMIFERWDKKNRTEGRIIAYEGARQLLAILKTAGTDILDPDNKSTNAVTSFPINLLSPSSQSSIRALISARELSMDRPYPYQRIGINNTLSRLEYLYGKDFVKDYRSENRISTINTNAGPVYNPDQGYIASKLSQGLLTKAIQAQKKFTKTPETTKSEQKLSKDVLEKSTTTQQKPTVAPQTQKIFENKNRLWYGGRLWDLNNDGQATERIFGSINRALDNERILIDTTSTRSGQLILNKKYMNKEDLAVLSEWQNQKNMSMATTQSKLMPKKYNIGGLVQYLADGGMTGLTNQYSKKQQKPQLFMRSPYTDEFIPLEPGALAQQNKITPSEPSEDSLVTSPYKPWLPWKKLKTETVQPSTTQLYQMQPDGSMQPFMTEPSRTKFRLPKKGGAFDTDTRDPGEIHDQPGPKSAEYLGAERFTTRFYTGPNNNNKPAGRLETHKALSSQIPSNMRQYFRDTMEGMFYEKVKNTKGLYPFQIQTANQSDLGESAPDWRVERNYDPGYNNPTPESYIRFGRKPTWLGPITRHDPYTIGLHEFEHQRQLSNSGFFNASYNYMKNEPPAVLSEMVHAAEGVRRTIKKPLQGVAPMTPNYQPGLEWMRRQAIEYDHIGGDKSMTELLNTPEGQAWLEMMYRDLANMPDNQVNSFKTKQSAIPQPFTKPTSEKEMLEEAEAISRRLKIYAKGGIVYASTGKYINFQPKGTDTVPAMLTPGEFVVNRQATQKNLPLLQSLNGGGKVHSIPNTGDAVYMSSGGILAGATMALPGLAKAAFDIYAYFTGREDTKGKKKNDLDEVKSVTTGTKAVAGSINTATSPTPNIPYTAPDGLPEVPEVPEVSGPSRFATFGKWLGGIGTLASLILNGYGAYQYEQESVKSFDKGEKLKSLQEFTKATLNFLTAHNDYQDLLKMTGLKHKFLGGGTELASKEFLGAATILNNAIGTLNYTPKNVSRTGAAIYGGFMGTTGDEKENATAFDDWQDIASATYNISKILPKNPYSIVAASAIAMALKVAQKTEAAYLALQKPKEYLRNTQAARMRALSSEQSDLFKDKIIPLDKPLNEVADAPSGIVFRKGSETPYQEDLTAPIIYLFDAAVNSGVRRSLTELPIKNITDHYRLGMDNPIPDFSDLDTRYDYSRNLNTVDIDDLHGNQFEIAKKLAYKKMGLKNVKEYDPYINVRDSLTGERKTNDKWKSKNGRIYPATEKQAKAIGVPDENELLGVELIARSQAAEVLKEYQKILDHNAYVETLKASQAGRVGPTKSTIGARQINLASIEKTEQDIIEAYNKNYVIMSSYPIVMAGKIFEKVFNNLDKAQQSIPSPNAMAQQNTNKDTATNPKKLAQGGMVYASQGALVNYQPRGTDTVPAMLTPGEFVVNRDSTQKHLGLLRAINSGEYSHGGIVSYLQNGGLLLPNYYQEGARVGPNNAGMIFDASAYLGKIIGQLGSSITQAVKDALNNAGNQTKPTGGVSNIDAGISSIDQFVSRLDRIVNALKDLDIPSEIKIVGQHNVNVVINGDTVLNQLKPDLAKIAMDSIKEAFSKFKQNNPAWQDSFNFEIK